MHATRPQRTTSGARVLLSVALAAAPCFALPQVSTAQESVGTANPLPLGTDHSTPGVPTVGATVSLTPESHSEEPTLEDLMSMDVTSVSGTATKLTQNPAAVFVVTPEDIRRGGFMAVPDALRMVPGMNVAQVTSSAWAVSARGFNSRFSNKLLVLMDGRPIYNDVFSGVYWDQVDPIMADLDRIEVVRGPGATLWGANAVNGVVSIVTKSAKETQGVYFSAGGGDEHTGFVQARVGGKIRENAYFRVYGKFKDEDSFTYADGTDAPDDWRQGAGGVRFDLGTDTDTALTLTGNVQGGTQGEPIVEYTLTPPFNAFRAYDTDAFSADVQATLQHNISKTSGILARASLDYAHRDYQSTLEQELRTIDVDARHHFGVGESHSIIWGVGYRNRASAHTGSNIITFTPTDRTEDLFSAFIQDTIAVVPDKVSLMVGTKVEHNGYSGFEVQPSARALWSVNKKHTVWTGVSRAVRTPSRANQDLRLLAGVIPPTEDRPFAVPVYLLGNPQVESEDLTAFEVGYRVQPYERLTLDFATYYNYYDNLISVAPSAINPTLQTYFNQGRADARGFEAAATWYATDTLHLSASYTFQNTEIWGSVDGDQGTTPRNLAGLRVAYDITESLEINSGLYYNDNTTLHDIPAYTRLDVGVTWRPRPNMELALWGQNLLDDAHPEYVDESFARIPIEIERGFYGMLTVRY